MISNLQTYIYDFAGLIATMVTERLQVQNTSAVQKEEFITIKEACQLLKVTPQTLLTYRKKYKIKADRIGGRVLLSKDKVLEAMREIKYTRA